MPQIVWLAQESTKWSNLRFSPGRPWIGVEKIS